jgi:Holliday junction resolvase RusA-like endonuclease
MLDSLLIADHRAERLLDLVVKGVHTEQLGKGNQPWDQEVAQAVMDACEGISMPTPGHYAWYAVHLRWFVKPVVYRRDLDNLRLKPILDALTKRGFWPDDNMTFVRALYNEAVLLDTGDEERVEVSVYGVPLSAQSEQ